ncbi:MAG: hypothetical protein AAF703_03140 [Cyanobacteria bacterium P01_D01_bin.105]
MPLITLLLTVIVAFFLSDVADAFPQILWGWVHWPSWLLWLGVVGIVAWCIGSDPAA